MRFKYGCSTDIGRKRTQNQDSVCAAPDLGLFVVADGMGGHRGGEIASRMVIEAVPEAVRKAQQAEKENWSPRTVISQAISRASRAIFDKALKTPSLQGMGTTTVSLLFKETRLTIGHVGDSRCYYIRPGSIWQATRDHSLVQEKLTAGLITRSELKTDRMKNVITRSVGYEADVTVEVYELDVTPGDLFLLCSDGLSGLVEDIEILELVDSARRQGLDNQGIVEVLIEAANRNGGDDNISAILVELDIEPAVEHENHPKDSNGGK
jgi:serine/threonine protein phosphatase PrpC